MIWLGKGIYNTGKNIDLDLRAHNMKHYVLLSLFFVCTFKVLSVQSCKLGIMESYLFSCSWQVLKEQPNNQWERVPSMLAPHSLSWFFPVSPPCCAPGATHLNLLNWTLRLYPPWDQGLVCRWLHPSLMLRNAWALLLLFSSESE